MLNGANEVTMKRAVFAALLCGVLGVSACVPRSTHAPRAQEPVKPVKPVKPVESVEDHQPDAAPTPGPRVHLPHPVIDLGTHPDTEVLTTEAVIQNVGDEVLELVYTEPGVSFAAGATLVEPGEVYRAPVTVDLNRRPRGPNEVRLRWHTNDPENRLVVVTLQFHVRPVVGITITPLETGG
jgi:hypothetical protein